MQPILCLRCGHVLEATDPPAMVAALRKHDSAHPGAPLALGRVRAPS